MRVKTSVAKRARHKKVLKEAKGYFGASHRVYRKAQGARACARSGRRRCSDQRH